MSAASCGLHCKSLQVCFFFLLHTPAGPGVHVRAPSPSTQAATEQRVFQELQSFPSTVTVQYQHNYGYQTQGLHGLYGLQEFQTGAQENPRAFDCPSIQITSIAAGNQAEASCGLEAALAVGGAEGGYTEPSLRSRGQLYLPLDTCYRDAALCPSPCSSLSSRSWLSDVSSCESFSHVYDDVEGELQDAARLALGSPLASPLGSPGCGGGAFGVELWQQQYQHPLAFSPALSPHQSPCQSPRTSVTEESWMHRRPASRYTPAVPRPSRPCCLTLLLAGLIPLRNLTSLPAGRPPGPRRPVGRDDTPVPTLTPGARPPLTTRPVPPRALHHEAASLKTPGWEVPLGSWGRCCSPSWMSRPKPGGGRGVSWASWPLRVTQLLSPFRTAPLPPLQRRVMTRMAWLTSSCTYRPTSAGTNPNLETHRCSGAGLCAFGEKYYFGQTGFLASVSLVSTS